MANILGEVKKSLEKEKTAVLAGEDRSRGGGIGGKKVGRRGKKGQKTCKKTKSQKLTQTSGRSGSSVLRGPAGKRPNKIFC